MYNFALRSSLRRVQMVTPQLAIIFHKRYLRQMGTPPPAGKTASDQLTGLIKPVPVFFMVTALAALVSGITVIQELSESFSSMSYGRVSFFIHILLPPATGLLAALGVKYAMGGAAAVDPQTELTISDGPLDADQRVWAIPRALQMAIVCLSESGEVTFLNPAAYALFESEFATASETVDHLVKEAGLDRMLDEVKQGGSFTVEEAQFTSDNFSSPLCLRITGSPILQNEEVVEVLLAIEDISEVKHLEEELIRSEDRYRNIFNHAQCGIFFVDRNGNYLDANPAALDMLGYSLEELTRLNTREISSESTTRIRRLLESPGWVVEKTRYMRKDGQVVDVELSASSYRTGSEVYFIGIAKDITGVLRLERELANARSSMGTLISTSKAALLMVDRSGKLLGVSEQAASLMGDGRESLIKKAIGDLVKLDGMALGGLEQGKACNATLPGGKKVSLMCLAESLKDDGGGCKVLEISESGVE
jgi:PAS domain S-box-containing protein